MGVNPNALAYAVVYDLTQNEGGTRSLGSFVEQHRDLIARRACEAVTDGEIWYALSLEYAGRLMALSWKSGRPFSDDYALKAEILAQRATALGFAIEDIASVWGSKAIVNLQRFAETFRQKSV